MQVSILQYLRFIFDADWHKVYRAKLVVCLVSCIALDVSTNMPAQRSRAEKCFEESLVDPLVLGEAYLGLEWHYVRCFVL